MSISLESKYLDAIHRVIMNLHLTHLTGASSLVESKKKNIREKVEIFPYVLFQFGVLFLAHHFRTYAKKIHKERTAYQRSLVGVMFLCTIEEEMQGKKEEYFLALEVLQGLAFDYPQGAVFLEMYPATKEAAEQAIQLFEQFLEHPFFDGMFYQSLPSGYMQEEYEEGVSTFFLRGRESQTTYIPPPPPPPPPRLPKKDQGENIEDGEKEYIIPFPDSKV
tara:strand:+ start:329 stop:988 length:660 start_codon:yes stop_codon:yes gene_type:complete